MMATIIDIPSQTGSRSEYHHRPASQWPHQVSLNGREPQLQAWAEQHREAVEERLSREGAVLLRGLKINGSARWEGWLGTLFNEPLLTYRNCSTPRTLLSGHIYTSTEYPPEESIPLHNENAYSHEWAMRLAFICVMPATSGGATPIADSRRVYQRLPAALRQRFERLGVMYVRNYGVVDLPWQQVFQSDDRQVVSQYCRDHDIDYEWHADGGLTTREVRQGGAEHPLTAEPVWFNQAHLFHLSSYRPEVQQSLLQTFGEQRLPRNTYYGDGSPISDEDLNQVRQAYAAESVRFQWQMGDVLLVDNMLCAHGRDPFSGPRKILVGMARPYRGQVFVPLRA